MEPRVEAPRPKQRKACNAKKGVTMKRALVCGAGGFIGSHLVTRMRTENYWVRGVDLKYPEFGETDADDLVIDDLRDPRVCQTVTDEPFDEVYQLAADMGGAGFVFSGENDADIMHNSALINLNMIEACYRSGAKKVFYSSSACIYPAYNQIDPDNPTCSEDSAYPAAPDSDYGWEKLFSERLYMAFARNYGMDVRIARLHNIFGHEGTWKDGREKAPAALCRKTAERSRCGGMGFRPVHFSTSTSALRLFEGSCNLISWAQSTLAPKRWSPSIDWQR